MESKIETIRTCCHCLTNLGQDIEGMLEMLVVDDELTVAEALEISTYCEQF